MKTKRCDDFMKDHRFLPVEKREPVDDYDDYAEENSDASDADDLFIGGEAGSEQTGHTNGKKGHNMLYIAS